MEATSIVASAPVFYDLEASALDGCPIEVGWAWWVGTRIQTEGHLVFPDPSWDIENSWNDGAQALHGISLKQLRSEGEPAFIVARCMNDVLADRKLFADSPFDVGWMGQLFDAAGVEPTFHLRRMLAPVLIAGLKVDLGLSEASAQTISKAVRATYPLCRTRSASPLRWQQHPDYCPLLVR